MALSVVYVTLISLCVQKPVLNRGALRVHGLGIGDTLGLAALARPCNPLWKQEHVAGGLPLCVLVRRAHCWSRASDAQHGHALVDFLGEWICAFGYALRA